MINKKIENGFYDVIATIKIDCGDSRNGIDLDKFLAQIIAIKKRFAHLTLKKVGFIGIGFDYAVANVIQLKGDDDQLSTSILISNIDDAKINSQINDIHNTDFYAGDIKDLLDESFLSTHGHPDVVITDPPRVGMHEDVCKMLLKAVCREKRFVQ